MERNYQDLALKPYKIDEYIYQFSNENIDVCILSDVITSDKRTIKLGYIGANEATINIFFKKDGLTTIQYKTGKNPTLGKFFADYLYETIDTNESNLINISLKEISPITMQELLDHFKYHTDNHGNAEFIILMTNTSQNLTQYQITSTYKDGLVITHHITGNLQIQGRSLFCYKIFMDWHCKWRTNATVHEAK